jgi:hypothetical protein
MTSALLEYVNVVPGVAPVDGVAGVKSQWIDLKAAHEIAFLVYFGALTTSSASDSMKITVEASTVDASTGATAIAFKYRLSSAVAANTWGAVTAATSAGYVEVAATLTGCLVWVQVDPADVAAVTDARWVQCNVAVDAAGITAAFVSVAGFVSPRYKGVTMISTT